MEFLDCRFQSHLETQNRKIDNVHKFASTSEARFRDIESQKNELAIELKETEESLKGKIADLSSMEKSQSTQVGFLEKRIKDY